MCNFCLRFFSALMVLVSTSITRADHEQHMLQFDAQTHGHAIEDPPQHWCALHILNQHYGLAVVDCSRAIKKNPTRAESFSNMSAALIFLEHYSEAEEAASKAIQLEPDKAIHYYKRGLSFDQRGRVQQALADYTKAIQLDRRLASAYMNRSLIWRLLGQTRNAIEDVRRWRQLRLPE